MFQDIKNKIYFVALMMWVWPISFVSAQNYLLEGIKCADRDDPKVCDICDFFILLKNAFDLMVAFSGTIALLAMIYGGVMYILAYINPGNAKKGKEAMIAAIIGLVIVFASYSIVSLILWVLTGKNGWIADCGTYGKFNTPLNN